MRDLNTLNDAALQAGPDDAEGAEMTDQAKPVGPCTNCGAPVVNGSVHSECPASPAAKPAEVPVVAWWVQAGPGMSRLAWLPGYPTQMHSEDALMLKSAHLAAMEALRQQHESQLQSFEATADGWMRAALKAKEEVAARDARIAELERKLNAPELHDFAAGVVQEAAHQRERWGPSHDVGKEPQDWFWLLGYLGGKALKAHASGDTDKALHHCISSAAALANWHAAISGAYTDFRPGIDPVARGIEPTEQPSAIPVGDHPGLLIRRSEWESLSPAAQEKLMSLTVNMPRERMAQLAQAAEDMRNQVLVGAKNHAPDAAVPAIGSPCVILQIGAESVGGSLVHPDDAARAGAAIGNNFDPMR